MDHQIVYCPACGGKMRLPRGKGVLSVTCPACKHKFRFDSGLGMSGASSQHTSAKREAPFGAAQNTSGCIVSTRSKVKIGPILAAILIVLFAVFLVVGGMGDLSDDSQLYLLFGCCALIVWAAVDMNNRAGAYIEVFPGSVQGKAIEGTFLAKIKEFHVTYSEIRNVDQGSGRTIVLFTVYGDYKVPVTDARKRAQVITEIRKRIF